MTGVQTCALPILKKIFLYQHKNGSWGRGSTENKIIYTSQGIQLMQTLGISHDAKSFKNAVRWLEDHVKNGEAHWTTRVEVGLKIGDFQKLFDDSYIKKFLDDLESDLMCPSEEARLDFFWDVIPTLIALHPSEKHYEELTNRTIPHEKIIARILDKSEDFGDVITVQFQANHTGLVALYLSTIQDKLTDEKYRNLFDKMIRWIFINREETINTISWQNSRGITAYVLIDLLGCKLYENSIQKYFPKSINYISPNAKGNVEKDNVITTFGTKLHAESLYISMLVIRAMTEVLKMEDVNKLSEIRAVASNPTLWESWWAKTMRIFYYNKKKMSMIICFIMCIIGIICYFINQESAGNLLVTIGITCVLTKVFQLLEKD